MRLLTYLLLLMPIFTFCQEEEEEEIWEPVKQLSLTMSYSSPFSDYSDTDGSNKNAGFATSGGALSFITDFNLNSDVFTITTEAGISFHSLDIDNLASQIVLDPNTAVDASSGRYIGSYVLVGVRGLFGNDKVKGYINPSFGFGSITAPDYDIRLSNSTGLSVVNSERTEGSISFAYSLKCGAQYFVTEHTALIFETSFYGAQIEDVAEGSQTFNGRPAILRSASLDIPVRFINVGFGLAINFEAFL